jgi:hypothetical protein
MKAKKEEQKEIINYKPYWIWIFDIMQFLTGIVVFVFTTLFASYMLRVAIDKFQPEDIFVSIYGAFILSFVIGFFSFGVIDRHVFRKAKDILFFDRRM